MTKIGRQKVFVVKLGYDGPIDLFLKRAFKSLIRCHVGFGPP